MPFPFGKPVPSGLTSRSHSAISFSEAGLPKLNIASFVLYKNFVLEINLGVIASKKLLMFTGYGGIGYNSTKTTFSADANFNLNGIKFVETIETNFESINDLRTNIGLPFALADKGRRTLAPRLGGGIKEFILSLNLDAMFFIP